jgi:hypothetical protein
VQGSEFSTARPVGFTIISFDGRRIGASRLHIESELLIQCTRIIVAMTLNPLEMQMKKPYYGAG